VTASENARTIVVSGGTDGMGRAFALGRATRGDRVLAIGSNPDKGAALLDVAAQQGARGEVEFLRADLTAVHGADAVVAAVLERTDRVDALALFANRQAPRRIETAEGLEATFALYYLSRAVLGAGLTPALRRSPAPVVLNVAGVGITKGHVHWDDPQLTSGYGMVEAQLQAGRANDLLGVHHAATTPDVPYVLYHPGFTRSGDLSVLPAPLRVTIRLAARIAARPVARSVAHLLGYVDAPPSAPLTARDRDRLLPLTLPTLDPDDARRLGELTDVILAHVRTLARTPRES
jgi:NAD(P)-dependent dehydrogenase (short-subunit alcohol dehydrogenase family)